MNTKLKSVFHSTLTVKVIGVFATLMVLVGIIFFPYTSFGLALTVSGIVLSFVSCYVLYKKS
jgi:membrane-bound ClpP family serine protease